MLQDVDLSGIKTVAGFQARHPEKYEKHFAELSFHTLVQHALAEWVLFGQYPGEFTQAILRNALVEVCIRADDVNREHIFDYAKWVYNHCPSEARGDRKQLQKWHEAGGLVGMANAGS